MEPTIYKPSIYKGAGIYKTGAGGGGGEVIPEGYKKCSFVKNIDVGSIFSYTPGNNPITNVSKDDVIKFYYEPGNSANSWIPETAIFRYYFSDTNSSRGVRIRTNTSANKSIINGYDGQIEINGIIKEAVIEKNYTHCDVNGASFSDQYSGNNTTRCDSIFYVNNISIAGGKLFYLKIYDSQENIKYNFLPLKKEGNIDVFYDIVNDIEFVLDTSKFICGPVIE